MLNDLLASIHRLTTAYARWVVQYRYAVALASIAVAVIFTTQIANLQVESSLKYLYEKDDAGMIALELLEDTFSKTDSTVVVIQPQQESIRSPKIIRLVDEITERLWQMPHTVRVDSITNYQHTRAEGDDLYVGDLLPDRDSLDERQANEIIDIAMSKPELVNRLINTETNVLGIVARAQIKEGDNAALTEAAEYVLALREEINQSYPDVRIALSGLVVRGYYFYKVPLDDMSRLVPLMLLLLAMIMWLLTRSIICPLITLILVGFSCGAAMGAGALLGIPVTTISSAAPVVILTVAVADSIHILMTHMIGLRRGLGREDAIVKSIEINAQPVFLTTLTTAIGFLSLNFSDSPPFRDLGNFAALGSFFAWFLSVTLLPAVLAIVPITPNPWIDRQMAGIRKGAEFALKFRRQLFVMAFGATAVAAFLLPGLSFNDDFRHYFDRRIDTDIDLEFIDENLSGPYQVHFIFDAGQSGGVYRPQYLQHLDEFSRWLKTQPEVKHVQTVSDVFKNLNRSMHQDDDGYYRISESKELNAQYMLLYEMSLPFGLDMNDQINLDKSMTRVDVTTRALGTVDFVEFVDRLEHWMAGNLPSELRAPPISMTLMFAVIGINNFEAMTVGTSIAFVLISICIGLSLASIRLGIISIVPNTFPIIVAFGIFALAGDTVGAWAVFIIPTALGLIVDATVHFLSKYNHARHHDGLDPQGSISYAFSTVGMALWVSTLVLVIGFSTLYFAITIQLQYLGIGTALIIMLALAIDFMVLPVLLIQSERFRLPAVSRARA